jgi:hypothetical protein
MQVSWRPPLPRRYRLINKDYLPSAVVALLKIAQAPVHFVAEIRTAFFYVPQPP